MVVLSKSSFIKYDLEKHFFTNFQLWCVQVESVKEGFSLAMHELF